MNHLNAFLGQSPAFNAIIRSARMLAATDVTVLIKGETGTEKEFLANAIQKDSFRSDKPFVTFNCAASLESWSSVEWESALFGHVRGALNGATDNRQGLLHAADGGTLFFDEIHLLPLFIQPKLLRFLETGQCLAVGDTKPYTVNVRIIAAANTDIDQRIAEGAFRRDLYFRLNIVPLDLPPLRQRTEDIPLLADQFLVEFARSRSLQTSVFSQRAIKVLCDYAWPGNIRELRHLCERLSILLPGKVIELENLPFEFRTALSFVIPISPKLLPEKFPPPWASTWGEDAFGLFAELHFRGLVQRFRWILPGSFFMGSPLSEPEREPWSICKETWHLVTLSKGFWLADTACTQSLWQAVMGGNPSHFKDDAHKPVETVRWFEVQLFIHTLNRQIAELKARLPSETEWEYACRAGSETPFSFGDNITSQQVNYDGNHPYAGGEKGEYRRTTVAVKSLPANAWGLFEMHGNVWEWCQDGWQTDLGRNDVADPLFDPPDQDVGRVLRGGSWNNDGRYLRSAIRNGYLPGDRDDDSGFRLVLG